MSSKISDSGTTLYDQHSGACPLLIVGAGGHGKVVADVALAAGYQIVGFVDDRCNESPVPGFQILGTIRDMPSLVTRIPQATVIVAIGDNAVRKDVASRLSALGVSMARVIHPFAVVSRFAVVGIGTVIMPGVVVNAGASIGNHAVLNTGCTIDHDCVVGDYAHISPGVHLAGNVVVGQGAHIGIGASVIPGCSIGNWSVIGAGAAVVEDIPDNVLAVGVPARVIKTLSEYRQNDKS